MWDLERYPVKYAGATVCLCLLALLGLWIPWVENTPQYVNGVSHGTDIGLTGLSWGFGSFDLLVMLGLIPAIVGTFLLQRWRLLGEACVFLSGLLICWWVGGLLYEYWNVEHYLIEPGIAIVVVSGLLLCILSVGAVLNRHVFHVGTRQPTG